MTADPRHILILTDRDWTHPEGGGAGTVLHGQVSRWIAWGHRVTVIAGIYAGAEKVSRPHERLTIHRMGSRRTVFPRAAWATMRGLGRDADVVLEVCDGIAFFTGFWKWLRAPRVLLVFRVHQAHGLSEHGLRRRVAGILLEHVPLRVLSPGVPVITTSLAAREDLIALGVARDRIHVLYGEPDRGEPHPLREPALLYRGRLEHHDRSALLSDLADALPEADLRVTGAGAHRGAIEAGGRTTPTATLPAESRVADVADGETAILADVPGALGEAASDTVRARGTLAVMDRARAAERPRLRTTLRQSEAGKAAGLAAATLVNNAVQLAFTIIFTRMLGKTGYGTLAALISAFLILLVAGQAAQLAAAREAALDRLGHPEVLRATLRAWTRRILVAAVVLGVLGAALQTPLARIIGVPEEPWGAAVVPLTGALWMLLSLQRGALQGLRAYGTVGWSIVAEAVLRLVCALALVAAGLNVTGALAGLPLAFVLVSLWLERELHRMVGPVVDVGAPVRTLRSLVGDGWVPIIGLFLLASLQNIDVIVAKHRLSADAAGSYAAAAVAAKTVVWVAIGIGLHLLPEATRRSAAGLDPRPVLLRALTILALVAAPALVIFAAFPDLLLRVAFGPGFVQASGALVLLGLSMTLLAVAYLSVQYMVALGERRFVWILAVVAIAEPFLLTAAHKGIETFATVVLCVQLVAAGAVLVMGLTARRRRRLAVA